MDIQAFGTLPIGVCFYIGTTLFAHAFADHVLRKVDGRYAECLDGSLRILVPAGTQVRVSISEPLLDLAG